MPQPGTTLPVKGLGTVNARDFIKGLYYAISSQLIALIYFGIEAIFREEPHFPTWAEWLPYTKAAVLGIVGYVIAKLGINNVGQILQKDKPVVHVDVSELNKLQNNNAQTKPVDTTTQHTD